MLWSVPASDAITSTCTKNLRTMLGNSGNALEVSTTSSTPMRFSCTRSALLGIFTFPARQRFAATWTVSFSIRLVAGVLSGKGLNMRALAGSSWRMHLSCGNSTTNKTSSTTRTGFCSFRRSRALPVESSSTRNCLASSLQRSMEIPDEPSSSESPCCDHGAGIKSIVSGFAKVRTKPATLVLFHHAKDRAMLSGQKTLGTGLGL
mmetsp:Transcript_33204/g.91868  ORF Transcript_33204/g.91868 Transcript_33204/m.91868 type:complete len:205 (+) Transcript_33204:866-1480(+)